MAFSYYNDVTRIRLQPMRGISIEVSNGDATTNTHSWDGVEKESSWRWRPATQPNRTGGERVAGWVLECTLYIPYNDYQTMQGSLLDLVSKPITEITVLLKADADQDGGAQASVTINSAAATVRSMHVTWEVDKVEWRSRMIVRIRGMYSKDVLEATDPDAWYTEVDGWA